MCFLWLRDGMFGALAAPVTRLFRRYKQKAVP